jgi:hypothetical protein
MSKNQELMQRSYLGARTAIAQDFPEKVAAATVEIIRFFAEYIQEKNNWEQHQDYNIVELRTNIKDLQVSLNDTNQKYNTLETNYIKLDGIYQTQTAYAQKLEQDLSETKNYAISLQEHLKTFENNRFVKVAQNLQSFLIRKDSKNEL